MLLKNNSNNYNPYAINRCFKNLYYASIVTSDTPQKDNEFNQKTMALIFNILNFVTIMHHVIP